MNVVVVGTKGSAVTTTALALAAGWPGAAPAIFVEADGSGGDVAGWFDLPSSPNLMTAATSLHLPASDGLLEHTQTLPGGARVIAAPLRGTEVTGALGDVSRSLLAPLRANGDMTLVVDAGRCDGRSLPTATTHADLVVVVVRQDFRSAPTTLARCVHTQHLVETLSARLVPTVAVLVGDRPYSDAEIAGFLGIDVIGVIEDDPHGAAFVGGRAASKRSASRARLAVSAEKVAAALATRLQLTAITEPFGTTDEIQFRRVAS
jgi:hypothetical protein